MDLSLTINEHVDFAANTELRKVDTRLDREAAARQHLSFFVRLQVVHVGAIAVRLLADGMAGAMTESRTVPGLLDHVARRLVHLPAAQMRTVGKRQAHLVDGRVPCTSDNLENLL